MGNNFGISATSYGSNYESWRPFTNNSNHNNCWASSNTPSQDYVIYNPVGISISNFRIRNRVSGQYAIAAITAGSIYCSNDNSNWTKLLDFTNSQTGAGAWWDNNLTTGMNKLYKLHTNSGTNGSGYVCIQAFDLIGTVKI